MNNSLLSVIISSKSEGNFSKNITNPFLKGSGIENFSGEEFLQKFLPNMIGLLLVFGSVAFFFMLLWGAISWITSGGDKAKIENARGRITSALIGIILMLSTFAIVKLIETFFGIDILSIDIGPLVIQ